MPPDLPDKIETHTLSTGYSNLIDERDVTCLETDVIGRSDTHIERKDYGQKR